MAGIYVHIPFCRKACHYCNFHFSTSFQKKDELINAIREEIKMQAHYLDGQNIKTVYFGGGTPSALPPEDLESILDDLRIYHPISPSAEITLEANPDDMTADNLSKWRSFGFNRLSIGIQAFQDELLTGWNRNHNAQQAKDSIDLAQQAGFVNISADLIYGGEGLTDTDWEYNIQYLIDADVSHVSAYALTVEKGTVLAHQIEKGKVKSPDDEQGNRQYAILQRMLTDAGYEQYEVSNFAKPGMRSIHNTSYWSGEHYLGIGPSAHSFNGHSRQWNVAHNIKYTLSIRNGIIPSETEVLSEKQIYNEIVMTGLRTSDGIDRHRIKALGSQYESLLETSIQPYILKEQIQIRPNGNYALLPAYYFFADGIASDLFLVS
jgi:oxygen-independent coproporphyrinogen-3 oxidase